MSSEVLASGQEVVVPRGNTIQTKGYFSVETPGTPQAFTIVEIPAVRDNPPNIYIIEKNTQGRADWGETIRYNNNPPEYPPMAITQDKPIPLTRVVNNGRQPDPQGISLSLNTENRLCVTNASKLGDNSKEFEMHVISSEPQPDGTLRQGKEVVVYSDDLISIQMHSSIGETNLLTSSPQGELLLNGTPIPLENGIARRLPNGLVMMKLDGYFLVGNSEVSGLVTVNMKKTADIEQPQQEVTPIDENELIEQVVPGQDKDAYIQLLQTNHELVTQLHENAFKALAPSLIDGAQDEPGKKQVYAALAEEIRKDIELTQFLDSFFSYPSPYSAVHMKDRVEILLRHHETLFSFMEQSAQYDYLQQTPEAKQEFDSKWVTLGKILYGEKQLQYYMKFRGLAWEAWDQQQIAHTQQQLGSPETQQALPNINVGERPQPIWRVIYDQFPDVRPVDMNNPARFDPRERYGVDRIPGILGSVVCPDGRIVGFGSDVSNNVYDRPNDQDFLVVMPEVTQNGDTYGLYFIADGAGGSTHGEKASEVAGQTIIEEYKKARLLFGDPVKALKWAFVKADKAVRTQVGENSYTTLTGAVVQKEGDKDVAYIANIADSRTYILGSKRENTNGVQRIQQITRDHNIFDKNIGGRASDETLTEGMVDVFKEELAADETILVCCDGIYRFLPEDLIRDVIEQIPDPEEAARRLLFLANRRGARNADNASVILLKPPSLKSAQQQLVTVLSSHSEGLSAPAAPSLPQIKQVTVEAAVPMVAKEPVPIPQDLQDALLLDEKTFLQYAKVLHVQNQRGGIPTKYYSTEELQTRILPILRAVQEVYHNGFPQRAMTPQERKQVIDRLDMMTTEIFNQSLFIRGWFYRNHPSYPIDADIIPHIDEIVSVVEKGILPPLIPPSSS